MTAPAVPPTGRNPASPGQHEAARDHVTRLRQDGGTYRSIAAAAALSPAAVYGLASGRRRAQPGTAAAVLTVTSPTLPRARLDAGGTRLRLRALHVMGHGSARIARAVGVHPVTIRKLVRGDARTISQQLRDTIADLYDAWWDKRAPRTHPLRARRGHRRAQTRHRRRLVRRRRPGRRPARHPRLPAPVRLETRHRHRRRPRHPPAFPPSTAGGGRMRDHWIGLNLFTDVLDVLERHGFARGDDQHAGRAIFLIGDLARIYEGSQDHPFGPSTTPAPSAPTAPEPLGPEPEPGPSSPKDDLAPSRSPTPRSEPS